MRASELEGWSVATLKSQVRRGDESSFDPTLQAVRRRLVFTKARATTTVRMSGAMREFFLRNSSLNAVFDGTARSMSKSSRSSQPPPITISPKTRNAIRIVAYTFLANAR